MLKARNLDDQTYEEIVGSAEGRLPWLCPVWTDHNAHDPGITILELMAWYKELQQYHMNQFTEELRCKLLKLAGITRRSASPARCAVKLDPASPERLAGERLMTREEIPFELETAVPARRPILDQIYVMKGAQRKDVGKLLEDRAITFRPFVRGDGVFSSLHIGLLQLGEDDLCLWFDVVPPEGTPRNPFSTPEQAPRVIRWSCQGAANTCLVRDDTHALSVSGYVVLRPEGDWPAGADGLHWLTLSLEDPGCEEEVRLSGVSAGWQDALQQETWARTYDFQAAAQEDWTVRLADAQARDGDLAVFLRLADGWTQTDRWQAVADQGGRLVLADTSQTAQDGADNVRIIALDPARSGRLLFDAKGLPGETFFLDLEGRSALTGSFTLLCSTLERDGQVRPTLWRCVEDLYAFGPRDRVFTYDPIRETVTFGDGEHGALLCRGSGAVLAASLTLSYCEGGNIPGGENLTFDADGLCVRNQAASGGMEQETTQEAQIRLLQQLNTTRKCVSVSDYERLAKETPGLRVAMAKALPAFDPDEPAGVSRLPTVTIVVVPAGTEERPLPDHRFLEAVQTQLDRLRPIGTMVKVIPPVYVDLTVAVSLRGSREGVEHPLEKALRTFLEEGGIGGVLRAGDVAARVQAVPGVLQVRQVDLRTSAPGCYRTADGDIRLPRQAIPQLKELLVEQLRTERLDY